MDDNYNIYYFSYQLHFAYILLIEICTSCTFSAHALNFDVSLLHALSSFITLWLYILNTITYQSRVGIDKVISALPSYDGGHLHAIRVARLSIHGHVKVTQWNDLGRVGVLWEGRWVWRSGWCGGVEGWVELYDIQC